MRKQSDSVATYRTPSSVR